MISQDANRGNFNFNHVTALHKDLGITANAYLLWRFDSRAKLYGLTFNRPPSQMIKENIWITVSGMYSAEPLHCAVAALGAERVLFAADYPFEDINVAGRFMDEVELEEDARIAIAHRNARHFLT